MTIHPPNKTLIAERLTRIALAKVYKQSISFKGPVYQSFLIQKNVISVKVRANSLVLKADTTSNFEIAGSDRKFYPAQAKLQGKKLIIFCKEVQNPEAVRYGFKKYFVGNLYDSDGLPAAPFRTDDW